MWLRPARETLYPLEDADGNVVEFLQKGCQ
jgi:hypothetical protein